MTSVVDRWYIKFHCHQSQAWQASMLMELIDVVAMLSIDPCEGGSLIFFKRFKPAQAFYMDRFSVLDPAMLNAGMSMDPPRFVPARFLPRTEIYHMRKDTWGGVTHEVHKRVEEELLDLAQSIRPDEYVAVNSAMRERGVGFLIEVEGRYLDEYKARLPPTVKLDDMESQIDHVRPRKPSRWARLFRLLTQSHGP